MSRVRLRTSAVVVVVAALVLTAACTGSDGEDGTPSGPATSGGAPSSDGFDTVRGVRVVTAGDIACEPRQEVTAETCRQADTARLVKQFRPEYVLPLGDLQYDEGDLDDFEDSYARTWGEFAAITRPVPGNHEYDDEGDGAAGYLEFFGDQTGGQSYYAFDIGSWRYYALDSNCAEMDCDEEAEWLEEDMAANPRTCTAIAMHHPRYSSSSHHGDSSEVRPLWEVALRHGADLALAGHDHTYERFEAMDADGDVTADGMMSFVVGTGGRSLYEKGDETEGSVLFYNDRPGVLDLKLGETEFGWRFRNVDGETVDAGVGRCH